MGNLPFKFGHARPLGSQIIRYVHDGQTDGRTDKNNAYCPPPALRGGGIIMHLYTNRRFPHLLNSRTKNADSTADIKGSGFGCGYNIRGSAERCGVADLYDCVQRLQMQKSVDSAYASGTSSGPDSDSTTNSLKAIWKRAISKLRRSHSSDEAKSSHASRNTSAGMSLVVISVGLAAQYNSAFYPQRDWK